LWRVVVLKPWRVACVAGVRPHVHAGAAQPTHSEAHAGGRRVCRHVHTHSKVSCKLLTGWSSASSAPKPKILPLSTSWMERGTVRGGGLGGGGPATAVEGTGSVSVRYAAAAGARCVVCTSIRRTCHQRARATAHGHACTWRPTTCMRAQAGVRAHAPRCAPAVGLRLPTARLTAA
jgi:hypothetical protein